MQTKLISVAVLMMLNNSCSKNAKDNNDSQVSQITSGATHFFKDVSTPIFPVNEQTKKLKFDVSDIAFMWPADIFKTDDPNKVEHISVLDLQNPKNDLIPNRDQFIKMATFGNGPGNFVAEPGPEMLNPFTKKMERASGSTDSLDLKWLQNGDQVIVTSFRIDDCGAGLHKGDNKTTFKSWVVVNNKPTLKTVNENCVYSLRLVASSNNDAAIHLIYSYEDINVLNAMIADLQYLKSQSANPTDGVALGIHPGLQGEKRKEYSQKVNTFIRYYAKPKYLTNLAFLSTNEFDGGDEWNFYEGEIHTNRETLATTFTMKPLHALKTSALSQEFSFKSDVEALRSEVPKIAIPEGVKTSITSFQTIINPERAFTSSLDCKGCHSEAKELVEIPGTYNFASVFPTKDTVFYRNKISGFPDSKLLPTDQANFRAFGWFKDSPTVNIRVAMKSAAIVSSINKRLFGAGEGNGIACQDKQHLVLRCVLEHAGKDNTCMKDICR